MRMPIASAMALATAAIGGTIGTSPTPPGAEGVARVRVFYHHGVNHRHVGGHRHAVVEKARIFEPPLLVVDVFLIQRPADPLGHPALDLALDIGGVDRAADILHGRIAQDFDVAGFLVDLDIADVRRKAGARTLRVDRHLGTDRAAGPTRFERDLGQGQRLEAAGVGAGRIGHAVLPFDCVGADVPDHRGALLQLLDDLLGGLCGCHAGREGDSAAAGQEREADRAGVGDDRADALDRDAEDLSRHHRHRGARAAHIRSTDSDDSRAVLVDVAGPHSTRRRC